METGIEFAVKRTMTGLGLFALQDIKAGQRMIEYIGRLITNEEADRKGGKYLFAIDHLYSLDGSARANTARYINHSCRPNAEAFITQRRRVWIWAKRHIRAGEEITLNYGKEYFDDHIKPTGCKCAVCRKA
jgi:uncharacterized protein